MPAILSACARQTYDVLPLEILVKYTRAHLRRSFIGVCSLNCTRALIHARVQSAVHKKKTRALTVCMTALVHLDLHYTCMTRNYYTLYTVHSNIVHSIIRVVVAFQKFAEIQKCAPVF